MLVAAFIPLAQAPEGIAGASILVAGRYDLRALLSGLAIVLRLVGLLIGAPLRRHGRGRRRPRRADRGLVRIRARGLPASSAGIRAPTIVPLARDRPEITRFVIQSGVGTSLVSMRNTLAPLALGIVASPTQVGYFRAAQAPITGLEALSAPVRLILLTEQTRDFEHGQVAQTYATLRRYVVGATAVAVALVPIVLDRHAVAHRARPARSTRGATDAARILLLAAALRLVLGWTKSFPVSIGRPGLRIVAHGVEIAVLLPLLLVFGSLWGATGAAVAMLAATIAFGITWAVLARCGSGASRCHVRVTGGDGSVRVLIVSGIWPPDVGGPASHAPAVADFLAGRGHTVEVVSRPTVQPEPRRYPVRWTPRRIPVGLRHLHALVLLICAMRAPSRRRLHDRHVRPERDRRPAHAHADRRQAHRRPRVRAPAGARRRRRRRRHLPGGRRRHSVARLLRALRDDVVRRAAHVYAPSSYLAELAITWGRRADRVSVLPNPGPAELPTPDARGAAAPARARAARRWPSRAG